MRFLEQGMALEPVREYASSRGKADLSQIFY